MLNSFKYSGPVSFNSSFIFLLLSLFTLVYNMRLWSSNQWIYTFIIYSFSAWIQSSFCPQTLQYSLQYPFLYSQNNLPHLGQLCDIIFAFIDRTTFLGICFSRASSFVFSLSICVSKLGPLNPNSSSLLFISSKRLRVCFTSSIVPCVFHAFFPF